MFLRLHCVLLARCDSHLLLDAGWMFGILGLLFVGLIYCFGFVLRYLVIGVLYCDAFDWWL